MGHAIEHIVVDKKEQIMSVAKRFASANVDRQENPHGEYHGNMTIHDYPIYESHADALWAIRQYDKGFYSDHAVRYKDKSSLKPTKAMLEIEERRQRNRTEKKSYIEAHSVCNRKSAFVGCKRCESKIATKYLNKDFCPVCGKDLRAQYVIDRLKKYDEDFEKLRERYEELEKKQTGKCPIRWLVKVEVHC